MKGRLIYEASDGSKWHIEHNEPVVPDYDWMATHDDYDGPGDNRLVHAESLWAVIAAVEEFVEREAEDATETPPT